MRKLGCFRGLPGILHPHYDLLTFPMITQSNDLLVANSDNSFMMVSLEIDCPAF